MQLQIIRLKELSRILGVSRASIYRKVREESFPLPVRLGPRSIGWRIEDVIRWRESLAPNKSNREFLGEASHD